MFQVGPVSPYDAEARALSHPVKKNIYMPRKMYPVESYSGGPSRWEKMELGLQAWAHCLTYAVALALARPLSNLRDAIDKTH